MDRPRATRRTVLAGIVGVLTAFTGFSIASNEMMITHSRTRNPSNAVRESSTSSPTVEILASDLVVPWGLDFNHNDVLYFTEREGRLNRLNSKDDHDTIIDLEKETLFTTSDGYGAETGLMGLAFHPDYPTPPHLYISQSYDSDADNTVDNADTNRVVRLHHDPGTDSATVIDVIIDGIPLAFYHDGGRLVFGPDKKLYVTCGDAKVARKAQDPTSLNGTVLRLNPDGSIPPDNPFGNPVFTYGHRNPQGLAFHPNTNELYSTEHGSDKGDEINFLQRGNNYGWPKASAGTKIEKGGGTPINNNHSDFSDVTQPLATYSTSSPSVAPGSAEFFNGDLYFGSLGLEHLRKVPFGSIDHSTSDPPADEPGEKLFEGTYGRIRSVITDPDGNYLYFTTSNRDGRASYSDPDDTATPTRGPSQSDWILRMQ